WKRLDDTRTIPTRSLGGKTSNGIGPSRPCTTRLEPGLKVTDEILNIAAAAVFTTEFNVLDTAVASVSNCIALQLNVGVAVKFKRQIEQLAFFFACETQQRFTD